MLIINTVKKLTAQSYPNKNYISKYFNKNFASWLSERYSVSSREGFPGLNQLEMPDSIHFHTHQF